MAISKNKKKKGPGVQDPGPPKVDATKRIAALVRQLAEPVCEGEALELVHVEYRPEASGRILRIYIDKSGGVTLDDCAHVSRQLGDILDVHLETAGAYHLEVSSPGPNRPLSKRQDFERFKGNLAKIRTARPLEGQKNFTGILNDVTGEMIELRINDRIIKIPFAEVTKACLVDYNGESECL